jgi:hypothetical protein
MGFPGYFLIVWEFINTRSKRKFRSVPGAVRRPDRWSHIVWDHGRRSDPIRFAFRTFSQPRKNFDAGYRHRFLRARARRSDQSRDGILRARFGLPDHHLRNDGFESGDQGCRARAEYALRRRRKNRQTDSAAGARAQHQHHAGARTSRRFAKSDGNRRKKSKSWLIWRADSKAAPGIRRCTPPASSFRRNRCTNWCRSRIRQKRIDQPVFDERPGKSRNA